MGLYRNVAGVNVGALNINLSNPNSALNTDSIIRLDPTTGLVSVTDPGTNQVVYFDPGTVAPSGTTQPPDPAYQVPAPVIPTPTSTITDTTPTTQVTPTTTTTPTPLPPAQNTQRDWGLFAVLAGLVVLSSTNETFIPKGKKVIYLGGVGVLYYLLSKRTA